MMYLMKCDEYIEEYGKYYFILRIDYVPDSLSLMKFLEILRYDSTAEFLYKLGGYKLSEVKRVQYRFRKYLYCSRYTQWFMYSEEILDFFKHIDEYNIPKFPIGHITKPSRYERGIS